MVITGQTGLHIEYKEKHTKKKSKESEDKNMFEKIRDLIVEEVGVDAEQVTMEASFKNDLHIDSLDLFEMVMTLEEEFDVEIPSEDLEEIDTVADLIAYIESHQE